MEKKKAEFLQILSGMFKGHENASHIVLDTVFFINATDKNDSEIRRLEDRLVDIAMKQPSWGKRHPVRWVPLELQIAKLKADRISIIHKARLEDMNKMNGDLALTPPQFEAFLNNYHSCGKIMYIEQPKLNKYIVTYPPALVNILRSFITDEIFWPQDETIRNALKAMTSTGLLTKANLMKIWNQESVTRDFPDDDTKDFLIQLLVHLDVLVIPRYKIETTDVFLVPCVVTTKMPMLFLEEDTLQTKAIAIVYTLQKTTTPPALAYKVIGAVASIWPLKEEDGKYLLYQFAAVLSIDADNDLRIIVDRDTNTITAYLINKEDTSCISPDIAASTQECLTFTLRNVIRVFSSCMGGGKPLTNTSQGYGIDIEIGEICNKRLSVIPVSDVGEKSSWTCMAGHSHQTNIPMKWMFERVRTI